MSVKKYVLRNPEIISAVEIKQKNRNSIIKFLNENNITYKELINGFILFLGKNGAYPVEYETGYWITNKIEIYDGKTFKETFKEYETDTTKTKRRTTNHNSEQK